MSVTGIPSEVAITISDSGRVLRHDAKTTLLETLLFEDEEIAADCGGGGICGSCAVRFISSPPEAMEIDSEILGSESTAEGWRLACHCHPREDSVVEIDRSEDVHAMRIETEGLTKTVPSMLANSSERLSPSEQGYGLAIDLGTTTIVCYLVDLAGDQEDLIAAFPNPQRVAGADVVSRIAYAHEGPARLEKLRTLVTKQIDRRLSYILVEEAVDPSRISTAIIVGNMTMTHLFRGADPWSLGVAPYQPEQKVWEACQADELGLTVFGNAVAHTFPGIAGHLGGDTVAGLLALDLLESAETSLFLDLGTNGEIVLVHEGKAYGCTCAAGPAFEGVRISCGMPAVPGAINDVKIEGPDLKFSTISDAPAIGLCGSGLADAIVAVLEAGLVEPSGRIIKQEQLGADLSPALKERVVPSGRSRKIALGSGVGRHQIEITQADIREVQLAKAAFQTGIQILCNRVGVSPSDVDRAFVAGGFGNALKPSTMVAMGILPSALQSRIVPAGNVAGAGARAALRLRDAQTRAQKIADWVQHMPLESAPDFAEAFTDNLAFPVQTELTSVPQTTKR